MSDDVQAYSEPVKSDADRTPLEIRLDAYSKGWKQGVIAMETWALEQGLDRKSVHSVAVQIMHQAVTQEERRATKYGEYQPQDVQANDDIQQPVEDFTGPEWQDHPLPEGIELDVVDKTEAEGDDASVDILALAQEDMAAAENHDEELPPFESELSSLINRYSGESVSGTPDFILARFLLRTLQEFNEAVSHRAWWRGEFTDFNPSRDVVYKDHFSGETIEHPSGMNSEYFKQTGKYPNYEQWKASQK